MGRISVTKKVVLVVAYLNNKGFGNFQIAEKTGLSEPTVSQILNKHGRYADMMPKKWIFKQPKTRKKNFIITQEQVDEVIELNQQGMYNTGISHSTGLSTVTVGNIINRNLKFAKMVPKDTIILDNRWKKQN